MRVDPVHEAQFRWSGGTFTSIDFPAALATGGNTVGVGINPAGDIVGQYRDAAGLTHGFVLDGSGFTTIDIPGGVQTVLTGINAEGQIVGRYGDAAGHDHGFLIDP